MELFHAIFSSLALGLSNFKCIPMQPGRAITLIAALSYLIVFFLALPCWKTKKQTVVFCSSVEAELCAMATMTAKMTWLRRLLEDFGVPATASTPFSSDSIGAISIARDLVKHELTKRIGVDASYVSSHMHDQVVTLHHVPSEG
jgi:hypothetical protein